MEKLKKIGIVTLIILLFTALIADMIYVFIYLFAPNKSTITTVVAGELNNVEDDNLKNIINIKYFKNADNSGEECFEVQFNYFTDENLSDTENNDSSIYSKGIQLVNPVCGYSTKVSGGIFGVQKHVAKAGFLPYYIYNMYQGSSYLLDYYSPNIATYYDAAEQSSTIFNKDFFRITVGEEIFKVTFDTSVDDKPFKKNGDGFVNLKTHEYYYQNNAAHFILSLYNSVKDLNPGENQVKVFEFHETFNYQKYDKDTKQYTDILNTKSEDYALITQELISYYGIKVDVYNEGITKASQSLFSCVSGQFDFNLTDENMTDDYFVGLNKVKLTELDFNYKLDENNNYYIELKDSVRDYYNNYTDTAFDISINMTYLNQFGLTDFIVDKSKLNLGNSSIYKFVKYTTNANGEINSTEVVNV